MQAILMVGGRIQFAQANMKRMLAIGLLCVILSLFVIPTGVEFASLKQIKGPIQDSSFDPTGPYVDEVIFEIDQKTEIQLAVIRDLDIDYFVDPICDSGIVDELIANPIFNVVKTQRFGFGLMAINCGRYPFSIPAFRIALAYALDKHTAADIMWGDCGFALDNPIGSQFGVWYNDSLTDIDYRDSNVEAARMVLASAGFKDLDGDGYVEAPDGSKFTFHPIYLYVGTNWEAMLKASKPYWDQAGISVEPTQVEAHELLDMVYSVPRNYDGALLCFSTGLPISTYFQKFLTENIINPEGNIFNWSNDDYDAYIDLMMNSSSLEEAIWAAYMAQRILLENVPMIAIYGNWLYSAYRTDRFEYWPISSCYGLSVKNHWTPQVVMLKEGVEGRDPDTGTGGTLKTMFFNEIETQNPLFSAHQGFLYGHYVLSQIYSSLVGEPNPIDQEYTPYGNGLASGWTKTLVSTPSPHWEFTFTLHQNATWHDGFPVTADDVVFSYNYIHDNEIPTYNSNFEYFDSIEKLSENTVRIIATSDSYWAWEYLNSWTILPEHIWDGILSPSTYQNSVPIGSGPFRWVERVECEYIQLEFHPGYHRSPPFHENPPLTGNDHLLKYLIIGVLVVIITIIFSALYLVKDKKVHQKAKSPLKTEPIRKESSTVHSQLKRCRGCGSQLWGDEAYCASCGKPVEE